MLPTLYARWIWQLSPRPLPGETNASCADCAMLARNAPPNLGGAFDPAVKCCSATPALPNFRVGAALTEITARETVAARLERHAGVSPMGLARPRDGRLLALGKGPAEGSLESPRCAHFDPTGGVCRIWSHREAVCATWFCKHERGAKGQRFWQTLTRLLTRIEHDVAQHCAVALGIPASGFSEASQSPEPTDPSHWGEWADRPEAYFRACAESAEALEGTDVVRLGGAAAALLSQEFVAAHLSIGALELPKRPRLSTPRIRSADDQELLLETYSPHDPIAVSHELLPVLGEFAGQPLDVARRLVEDRHRVVLTDELLSTLSDFEVLMDDAKVIRAGSAEPIGGSEEAVGSTVASQPVPWSDAEYHLRMLADVARVDAYARAIEARIEPGMHVLEVGCGTGVLSILAAKRGARVTAIEAGPTIVLAEQMAQRAGVADRIRFIQAHSSQVTLAERCDALVTELVGNEILDERMLEVTLDAKRRLLEPGAVFIPGELRIFGQLGEATGMRDALGRMHDVGERYGIDFAPVREAFERAAQLTVPVFSRGEVAFAPLSEPAELAHVTMADLAADEITANTVVAPTRVGTAGLLRLSFELSLAPGIALSTVSDAHGLHWNRPIVMLPTPRAVKPEAGVSLALHYRAHGRLHAALLP